MVRRTQDADAPYVDGVVARRRPDLAPVQAHEGRHHRAGAVGRQGRRHHSASSAKGSTYIFSAAKFGEPFTNSEIVGRRPWRRGATSASRSARTTRDVTERAIFRDVRLVRPTKDGFVPYARLHRQRARDPRRRRAAGSRSSTGPSSRSRRPTGRTMAAPSSTTPAATVPSGADASIASTSLTRQPTLIDTGTNLRNNNDHVLSFDGTMLGISDQSIPGDRVDHLHGAGRRRHAEADYAARPVVPAQLVAGREVPDLHGRAGRRVRHLPHRLGRQRDEVNLTNSKGLDDGPEYSPRRQIHLLQLGAKRVDADLADGPRRQRTRSRSRTTSSTTGSRTSRPTGSGLRSSVSRRTSTRPTIPTTSGSTCG